MSRDPHLINRALKAAGLSIWALLLVVVLLHRNDLSVEAILSYVPESPLLGSALGMGAEIVLFPVIGENLGNPRAAAFWVSLGLDLLISAITVWISKRTKKEDASP